MHGEDCPTAGEDSMVILSLSPNVAIFSQMLLAEGIGK
jgi:hypothetical protein